MSRAAPPRRIVRYGCAFFLALAALSAHAADAPAAPSAATERSTLERIRDTALGDPWAYERLAELTDLIGPRLSGSVQDAAAVEQMARVMRALGARVTVQPARVPHWVRGEERAEVVQYPGQPEGIVQKLRLTALGSSGATAPGGLVAPLVVVHDYDELQARAAQVPGSIVLFETRFDQRLAENGHAGAAYGQAGKYRFGGPSAAAKLGAAAVLVRSVGGADHRSPHTGITMWSAQQAPIPAAALAAEDADLLERLSARGPVRLALVLTPQTLPDARSANVIADWPGREKPEEIVIVSGHLDSWDLGTGATDDGVGVIGAAAVVEVLQRLGLHARRTIRFVGWASEESGSQGAKAYMEALGDAHATHVAVIESDSGAGHALGIEAAVTRETLATLQPLAAVLAPLGAGLLERADHEVGADIAALQELGVPGFAPLVDTRHYFDYHHTYADTLDKVDPANLRSQVATMAVLAYFLADSAAPPAPFKPGP
jgi:hypothetical protein